MKNNRTCVFMGILTAGAVALSACGSQAPPAAAGPGGVVRVENVNGAEDKITVSSSESVKVAPDMAEIVYGVYTEETDAAVCQKKNTEAVNAVIEFLKGQGFEEKSIKTSGYSLDPRYDWSGNKQTLIGYEMRTQITVSDVPLDEVGGLLSNAVSSGANGIESVAYLSSSYDEIYQKALAKAVELARGKAQALAEAGGRELDAIVRIEEYGNNQSGRYVDSGLNSMAKEQAASGAGARAEMDMAVMPGEMEVRAQISVEFSLKAGASSAATEAQ